MTPLTVTQLALWDIKKFIKRL